MDVLSDVLGRLRVEGTLSRQSVYSAPWGISYPPGELVGFLIVEEGSAHLLVEGAHAAVLCAGDVVMFRPGLRTALADHPSSAVVPYTRVLEESRVEGDRYARVRDTYPTLTWGGGGQQTVLRGFGARFDGHAQHPVMSVLPPFVHLTHERRRGLPWLETTVRFILQESRERADGADMMTVRLVELLFVQILRAWFQEQPAGEVGWLGALRDDAIHHALKLVHQYPADPWSVDGLAKAVGMSRSSFSARFTLLVGDPPLRYLTRLRMRLAADVLKGDRRVRLSEVAEQVGYDSESSFGRAFKRTFGVSPGTYRARHR